MKRNLTIQLDESTIKEARIVAARQSISISQLVRSEISKAFTRDSIYEKSKKAALKRLNQGYDLDGATLPSRDELHER
jgi:hypothetical protein